MTREEFARRIEDMQDVLYRVAYGLLLNPADCADAAQECIFKAWRGIDALRDERYLQTWVIRILIHECYAIMRKRRSSLPLDEGMVAHRPADSANEALCEAIAALPEKLRLVVVLHYIEGYKEAEVAQMLRCPLGTVKSRLRRARLQMRGLLAEEGRVCDAKA